MIDPSGATYITAITSGCNPAYVFISYVTSSSIIWGEMSVETTQESLVDTENEKPLVPYKATRLIHLED